MKSILIVLALIGCALAVIPSVQVYDNTYYYVDIPKGTFYQFYSVVPAAGFSSAAYVIMNISLGTVVSTGHQAWIFCSNNTDQSTAIYLGTAPTVSYVALPLNTFACNNPSGYCTLYFWINATCSDLSGCFSTVTTEISLYGALKFGNYYQPMYSPIPGVGFAGFPTLIYGYKSISYPTTTAWQYFKVSTTASFLAPLTVFPSITALPVSFSEYGCTTGYPNATNACGWVQTATTMNHTFAVGNTYIGVSMSGSAVGILYSTYQIGLTSVSSMAVVSMMLLFASLLLSVF